MFVWPAISLKNHGVGGIAEKFMPIVIVPLGVYCVRWAISAFYHRHISHLQEHLESLKRRQRQKIEELKQKMNYYAAKTLIERYDDSEVPGQTSPRVIKRHSRGPFKNVADSIPAPVNLDDSSPTTDMPAEELFPVKPIESEDRRFSSTKVQELNPAGQGQSELTSQTLMNDNSLFYQNQPSVPRSWIDRVLDLIIGEEAPGTKYALICEKCFQHNGLALEEELETLKYICPRCGHLNLKRYNSHGLKNGNEIDVN